MSPECVTVVMSSTVVSKAEWLKDLMTKLKKQSCSLVYAEEQILKLFHVLVTFGKPAYLQIYNSTTLNGKRRSHKNRAISLPA